MESKESFYLCKIFKSVIAEVADNVDIREFCTIRNSEISKECHISERVSIKKSILLEGVEVNAGSYIENVLIGKNVQIGPNCSIVGVTHNFSAKGVDKEDVFERIRISQGSWVAANCVVLPGVVIGENSIIAAGSVVGIEIPDCHIYLGDPSNYKMVSLDEWEKRKQK